MGSELAAPSALAVREWEARKKRIGAALGEIADLTVRKIKDILPDIRAIKDKKLWRIGGYKSFEDFSVRGVGVTKQGIYKALAADDQISATLEILPDSSTKLTNGDQPALPDKAETPPPRKPSKPAQPKREEKQAKVTEIATEENLHLHVENLPPAAKVCPHCGQPIPAP